MNLNRRELFTLAGAGAMAYLTEGCAPTFQPVTEPVRSVTPTVVRAATPTAEIAGPVVPPETYMHPRLIQMGRELSIWQANQQRVVDRFPESQQISDLLTGKVNPRNYLSTLRLPVGYIVDPKLEEAGGQIEFTWIADPNDPRRNTVTTRGNTYQSYWVKEFITPLFLAPEVDKSRARLPVMLKEASQLVYYEAYCRLYLVVMNALGYTTDTETLSPNPPITSLQDRIINQANALRRVESTEVPVPATKEPLLDTIIDVGSLLRSCIYFGIWLDEPTERELKTSARRWVLGGKDALGFMIDRRMIRRDGLRLSWSAGKPPEIVDKDFWGLIKAYAGLNLPY